MKSMKLILVIFLLLVIAFFSKGLFFAALVNGRPLPRLAIIKDLEKRGGKQVLESMIAKELIFQEAAKKNVEVNKKEVDNKIKDIEKNTAKQGQQLDQLLTLQGMTRADLQSQIEVQLILEKLLKSKLKVSNKEVDEFIKKTAAMPPVAGEQEIKPPTSAEAKDQLKQQKFQKESQALVEQLRKSAKISLFVNY